MSTYEGKVRSDSDANVRKSPDKTATKIDTLKAGKHIKGDKVESGWMHITEPTNGWILASLLDFKETVQTTVDNTPKVPTDNTSSTPSNIHNVLKWGDPIMVKYDFTLAAFGQPSHFQGVPLYDATGKSGSISISKAQILHLKSLQTSDDFAPEKKMNWLAGKPTGRSYLSDGPATGDFDWKNAGSLLWQAIAYGGQPVTVLETLDLPMDLPKQAAQTKVKVARILLYDMSHPDEGAIQHATACRGADLYNPTPDGMVIRAPIWKGQYEFIPFEWLEA